MERPHPSQITYRSSGAVGADRTVVLVREGSITVGDPDPSLSSSFGVRLVSMGVPAVSLSDHEAFGGETPDEEQSTAVADLMREQGVSPDRPAGMIALGAVGWRAAEAAVMMGPAIDRIAFVDVSVPVAPLARTDVADLLTRLEAKLLVVAGESEQASADAAWIVEHSEGARRASAVGTLADVWSAVLAHVAPGARTG